MLNSWWIAVPVAVALGFLSGMGTGGGSLLILWLTMVPNVPQSEARTINLMFFVPAAVIACFFRWRQGKLNLRKVLPGIAAGCAAAAFCSFAAAGHSPILLKKGFGLLLIGTGIRELLYKKKSR